MIRSAAPKRWRRLRIALAVLAFFGVVTTVVANLGERLFYYPWRGDFETPEGVEDVWFESDGRKLHGWFLPAEGADGAPKPTIVHVHGNALNIGRHIRFVEFLPEEGFNVFLFDYRSYGRSEKGPLKREGLITDAKAAIETVMQRPDVDTDRVGVYGLSLGGTMGLAAAADDQRVKAVVSVATFSRWREVAGDYTGWFGRSIIDDGRDAVDSAAGLGDRPLLLLHGTSDAIVDYRHGPIIRDAAAVAGVDVELLTFEGVGHVDWLEDEPALPAAIVKFFKKHLGPLPE